MRRYRVDVSYDGSAYEGWQRQKNKKTIQGTLEEVLTKILNSNTLIHGSGRTDAGVHALGQVFHFDTLKELDLEKTLFSLNCLLPQDIHVLKIKKVPLTFHARLSAKGKTYVYYLNNGKPNPFLIRYEHQLNQKLNLEYLKHLSQYFLGQHNFLKFTSKKIDRYSYYRTIAKFKITQKKGVFCFEITGDGFMRYMIRLIIGTMVAISLGKEKESFIQKKLLGLIGTTTHYKVPSQGLYLKKVIYGK